jgi:hypothetical protein
MLPLRAGYLVGAYVTSLPDIGTLSTSGTGSPPQPLNNGCESTFAFPAQVPSGKPPSICPVSRLPGVIAQGTQERQNTDKSQNRRNEIRFSIYGCS